MTRDTQAKPIPIVGQTEIIKLNTASLNHETTYLLAKRTLSSIDESLLDLSIDVNLITIRKEIVAALSKSTKVLQDDKSDLSQKEVKRLEKQRKQDLSAIKSGLNAYKNSRNAQEQAAFQQISKKLQDFKDINQGNSEKMSLNYQNLIRQLEIPEFRQALVRLNLLTFYQTLKESQTAVEASLITYNKALSTKPKNDSSKDTKTALHKAYQKLIRYLDILVEVSEMTIYSQLITLVNTSRLAFIDKQHHKLEKKEHSTETLAIPAPKD